MNQTSIALDISAPMWRAPQAISDRLYQKAIDSATSEGRAAYRLKPYSACPPFKSPDLEGAWRTGWRDAHHQHFLADQIGARPRCLRGCGKRGAAH